MQTNDSQDLTDREVEQVWAAAQQEFREEARRSLRDRTLWRAQALNTCLGVVKAGAMISVVASIGMAMGVDTFFSWWVGAMVTAPILVTYRKYFFRNLFSERAWEAFDAELDRQKRALGRGGS